MRLRPAILPVLALLAATSLAEPRSVSARQAGSGSAKVLLVDLDDVGYDLLGPAPTPTLDWIRARGRFFTSFVVAPACTPTRVMVQMGAYPSHPGVLTGQNVSVEMTTLPLAPLVPLARHLSESGLTTAKVGKWHLAPRADTTHPQRAGYRSYAGAPGNLALSTESYFDFDKVTNGAVARVTGAYLTSDETNDGIRFVRAGFDFVSVSYHAPHAPWHEPPAHLHTFANIGSNVVRARAMLQACDAELGRLVRAALEEGYTVLVFSDNGTAQPIFGQKGTPFEGGIVVPMWAIGPGVAPGEDDALVGAVDLYATVAELLGAPASGTLRGPDSRSFARVLRGEGAVRRWAYSERFTGNGQDPRISGLAWVRVVRGNRFKLIRGYGSTAERLYDIELDPGEFNDLLLGPTLAPDAAEALTFFRTVMGRL